MHHSEIILEKLMMRYDLAMRCYPRNKLLQTGGSTSQQRFPLLYADDLHKADKEVALYYFIACNTQRHLAAAIASNEYFSHPATNIVAFTLQ